MATNKEGSIDGKVIYGCDYSQFDNVKCPFLRQFGDKPELLRRLQDKSNKIVTVDDPSGLMIHVLESNHGSKPASDFIRYKFADDEVTILSPIVSDDEDGLPDWSCDGPGWKIDTTKGEVPEPDWSNNFIVESMSGTMTSPNDNPDLDQDVATNTAITAQESTIEQEIPFQKSVSTSGQGATSESKGDLERVAERYIKILTTNWDQSAERYKILVLSNKIVSADYPKDILNKTAAFSSFLKFFAYARCNMRIKVVVNATKFCTGAIAVCYAAVDGYNSLAFKLETCTYTNIRAVPHTIVNIQNATEGSFVIGFNNKTMLFDRENTEPRGHIFPIVWSKYQSVLGAPTQLPVTIYAKVEDLQVFGMTNEKTPFSVDYYMNARSAFEREILRLEDSGVDVSAMYDLLNDVTAKLRIEANYQKMNIASYFVNTVNTDVADPSIDLSFRSQSIQPGGDTLSQVPLSFSELLKIPVPILTHDWAATAVAGVTLFTFELGPRLFGELVYGQKDDGTTWKQYSYIRGNESIVSHISKFGHYWRGNLKFTFEFFNAALHKGRVQIGYAYGTRDAGDFDLTGNYITHDLGEEDKSELVVPYVSWRDWMQVPSLGQLFVNNHGQTKKYKPINYKTSSLGTITVKVMNRLITNNTMPGTIEIKVSVSCHDFELVWPRFDSQHMDGSVCSPNATAWNGQRRVLALNSTDTAHYYPQVPPFVYGDVPNFGLEMKTESFVGSFASQPLETTVTSSLPVSTSLQSSYISNHVTIDNLMTRPALAMHGTFILSPTYFTSTVPENTKFTPREFYRDNVGSTASNSYQVRDHEILLTPDGDDFCQLAPYSTHDSSWKTTRDGWPWVDQVKPVGQQLEICRLGTYWQGRCRVIVNVDYCKPLTGQHLNYNASSPEKNTFDYISGTGSMEGTLYITYADTLVGSEKDILANGAFAINLKQQRQVAFEIPYYQIEQVKRLDESDLRIRLYLSSVAHCAISISVYYQFFDFKLYFPTLMPQRLYIAGGTKEEIKDKTHYIFPIHPANLTPFSTLVPQPGSTGTPVTLRKVDLAKTLSSLEAIDLGYKKDLTSDGDVESNPGPVYGNTIAFPRASRVMIARYIESGREPDYNEINNIYSPSIDHINCSVGPDGETCKICFGLSGQRFIIQILGKYCKAVLKAAKKKLVTAWLKYVRDNHPEIFEDAAQPKKVAVLGDFVVHESEPVEEDDFIVGLDEDFRTEGFWDELVKTPANLLSKVTKITDGISSVINTLSRVDQILYDAQLKYWSSVLHIFLEIAHIINNPEKATIAIAVSSIGLEFAKYVAPTLLKTIYASLTAFFSYIHSSVSSCFKTEADIPMVPIIGGLATGFSALLIHTLGSGVTPTAADGMSIARGVGCVTGAAKNSIGLMQMLWKTVESTLTFWIYGLTPEERISEFYKENATKIKDWYNEVADINDHFVQNQLLRDFALCTRVRDAHKFGREIHRNLFMSTKFNGYFTGLRESWTIISKWYDFVMKTQGADKPRPEPVVVYLYGPAGAGKSVYANHLAKMLSQYLGDRDGRFWSRPTEAKHFDGYAQQPVVLVDDIGANRNDEDWSCFLQMVSTAPFIPPMAANEFKGNPFVSPVIICTSNHAVPAPITLHHRDPVVRRLTFPARVLPKANYLTPDGKLDMGAATLDGSSIDMSCVDIQRCHIDNYNMIDDLQDTTETFRRDIQAEIVRRARIFYRSQEGVINPDSYNLDMTTEGWWTDFTQTTVGRFFFSEGTQFEEGEADLMIAERIPIHIASTIHFAGCAHCHKERRMATVNGQGIRVSTPKKFCLHCLNNQIRVWDRDREAQDAEQLHRLYDDSYDQQCFYIARQIYGCPDVETLTYEFTLWNNHNEMYNSNFYNYLIALGGTDDSALAEIGERVYWFSIYRALYNQNLAWNKNKFGGTLGTIVNKCTDHLAKREVCRFVTRMAAIYATFKVVSVFVSWLFEKPEVEAYSNGEPAGRKVTKKAVAKDVKFHKIELDEAKIHRIKQNQYEVMLIDDIGNFCNGMVTFLDHNTIMMCDHMFLPDRNFTTLRLLNSHVAGIPISHEIDITDAQMVCPEDSDGVLDLRILRIRTPVCRMRSIIKHFATENEIAACHRQRAVLSTKSGCDPRFLDVNIWLSTKPSKATSDSTAGTYRINQCMRYVTTGRRGPGDSGALVIGNHDACPGKIIGMHHAGNGNQGSAMPISLKLIEGMLNCLEPSPIPYVEPPPEFETEEDDIECMPFLNEFTPVIGEVDPAVHIHRKTKILPSPLQGEVFPVRRHPAALFEGDKRVDPENVRDPISNMVKKHAICTSTPRDGDLNKAVDHISQLIYSTSNGSVDVLDEHVAVNGLPPGQSMDRVDMRTGAGYPYCEKGSKRYWLPLIEDGGDDRSIREELLERLHERIELAKQRKRIPGSYYRTALKDELRSWNKIVLNGARTIEGCPLDYLLAFRQYFGSFLNWITMNYGGKLGSCVGCDPNVDWTYFRDLLLEKGPNVFGIDYVNWDGTQSAAMVMAAWECMEGYYLRVRDNKINDNPQDEEEICREYQEARDVRATLMNEIAFTISVVQGKLVLTSNGLPSGHPCTAILNCIIHKILCLLAWLEAHRVKGIETSCKEYEQHVANLFYGDDGLLSVSDEKLPVFNRFSLAKTARKLGMSSSMPDKSPISTPTDTIDTVEFLKRRFVVSPTNSSLVLAPIDEKTLGGLLNWLRQSAKLEDNINAALEFAYHHGPEYYGKLVSKIAGRYLDTDIYFPSYAQQQAKHYNSLGMLTKVWRQNPICPPLHICLSRLETKRRCTMKKVHSDNTVVCRGCSVCKCGKKVFGLIDLKCLCCHGFVAPDNYICPGQSS